MLVDILGVLKDVPVPKALPPLEAAYQLNVPALAVACKLTDPDPQIEPGVVAVTVGTAVTVIIFLTIVLQPVTAVVTV